MAALDDLISQIPDESLRERIRAEVKWANRQKKFGLVFEEHLPEATPLYDIPVKRGSVVAKKDGQITDIYYVVCRENRGWTGYLFPQGVQGARRASYRCAGLRGPIW